MTTDNQALALHQEKWAPEEQRQLAMPVREGFVHARTPPNEGSMALPVTGDGLLPATARSKYRMILREASAENAIFGQLREEERIARGRLNNAKQDPGLVRQVPMLEENLREIQDQVNKQQLNWHVKGELARWVKDLVEDLKPPMRAVAKAPVTFKKPPSNFVAEVEATRLRLGEMQEEFERIKALPIPVAEAKRLVHQQVLAAAERGRPNVDLVINGTGDGLVHWATNYLGRELFHEFACWQDPDRMTAALHQEIDRRMEGRAAGISDTDKADKLAQLSRDMLLVERTEETLIELAFATGIIIARRADANPLAVLGIEIEGLRE
jgi:hypothetical protein